MIVSHYEAQPNLILKVAPGGLECTAFLPPRARGRLTGVANYAQLESSSASIQSLNRLLLDGVA